MKGKKLLVYILVLQFILSFPIITFGSEAKDDRLTDDWDQYWFGGDFSDVECGVADIHISFSEDARELFGTCEAPINLIIKSEGDWWTYGGRKFYSDIIPVKYDEKNGYLLEKKLPYGKYVITDWGYLGDTPSSQSGMNYLPYTSQPQIYFELSKEEPELPVFMEIQNYDKIDCEGSEGGYDDEIFKKYSKIFDDAKKKGINPYGKAQFHAAPKNIRDKYFAVVELSYGGDQQVTKIHYFGKTNDYTYTAELYPGIYGICRAYFIDDEGNVLGEDETLKGYTFTCSPQSETIKINLTEKKKQEVNPEPSVTEVPKESVSEANGEVKTDETANAATNNTDVLHEPKESVSEANREAETKETVNAAINNTDVLHNQKPNEEAIILYYVIAFIVLAGIICGSIYLIRSIKSMNKKS